jgi:FkbM family methyltransferase
MNMTIQQYEKLRPIAKVSRDGTGNLLYTTPNQVAMWRVQTLFTKEPATIEWLDRIKPEDVLLDVGANVGMYTIYAARQRGAKVYAFEPESQNFALLVKNIVINKINSLVVPFCAALSDSVSINTLYLSDFAWDGGSSCHSFGAEVGFDLKPRKSPVTQGCLSYTIDQAVEHGAIEVPTHIKIDVDGFEHKVVAGAMKTLSNPKVRSLCIEINPSLEEHQALIRQMEALGFYFDPQQVERVARTSGSFEGCAEYVFDRLSAQISLSPSELQCAPTPDQGSEAEAVLQHILEKVTTTPVTTEPYPYVVIDDIFPTDYYQKIIELLPHADQMIPLGDTGRVTPGSYEQRLVTLFTEEHFSRMNSEQQAFWRDMASWLYSEKFLSAIVDKFKPWCSNLLSRKQDQKGSIDVRSDALIVNDQTRYEIGPHTDAPHRLISFLFYLPQDDSQKHLGTSIYTHKDPSFTCPGGPHYKFEYFNKLKTVEFLPNRLLMFVRTNKSFHGVEEVQDENVSRRLLINNVRMV